MPGLNETIATGYAGMVDSSTAKTLSESLANAADSARADAAAKQERASELRVEAAGMEDKPGMADAATNLIAEAVKAEDDAEQRLGMAAAFEDRAAVAANVA
jgi:hypothetical protein